MYDGLLLDHDGVIATLCDASALTEAARGALRDAGVTDPDEAAVDTLSVRVDDADLREVARRHGVDPDRLWRHRDDRIRDTLCAETRAGRKAPYDDVGALAGIDLPAGVVSNNQTRIVEFALEHYGLADRFGTVRARSPVRASLDRKKPNPDYLDAAMADLGVENPLYVGDSESDVVAGQRAGLDVAFLRREHNADRRLDADATYDVDGLAAVADILD
jgi:phosphoglycolate phosphatase-like HAD superfamily hydrolase